MIHALAILACAALLPVAPALAQSSSYSYLVEPDLATARARSAQACAAMHCRGGTLYWWPVVVDPKGVAIAIAPSGAYATQGLTASEIAALQSYATLKAAGWFAGAAN